MTEKLKVIEQISSKENKHKSTQKLQRIEKEFLKFVEQTINAKSTYDGLNNVQKIKKYVDLIFQKLSV